MPHIQHFYNINEIWVLGQLSKNSISLISFLDMTYRGGVLSFLAGVLGAKGGVLSKPAGVLSVESRE